MTQQNTRPSEANSPGWEIPKPAPALQRLQKLVGTWELKGRPLDSQEDTITGHTIIDWMQGGFFLELRGEMEFQGYKFQSLEILSYDPETDTFPAMVYSSLGGVPMEYHWDVQGDVVTHWTKGAKYTGKLSEDGNVLAGGWRPDEGIESKPDNTYDATMIRVK